MPGESPVDLSGAEIIPKTLDNRVCTLINTKLNFERSIRHHVWGVFKVAIHPSNYKLIGF